MVPGMARASNTRADLFTPACSALFFEETLKREGVPARTVPEGNKVVV